MSTKKNKKVSFGKINIREVLPYKEENRANSITKDELKQSRMEARLEKEEQKEIQKIADYYRKFIEEQNKKYP